MSFLTEISLVFNSPNKVASSANNATGYKIYRNIQSDPCPGGVIDPTKEIATGSLSGTDPLTYNDTDTAVSVAYFYRVSWLRGSEEVLGEVVGPLMIGSLYELGYPNNVPSNTSGNPNFLDIEPLVHFDATWEYNIGGPRAITQLNNLSDNYPSLSQGVSSTEVGTGIDGSTPIFQAPDNGSTYQQLQGSIDTHAYRADILNKWNNGTTDDDVGAVVYDEGITVAWVFMGSPQNSFYWDGTNHTSAVTQATASGHFGFNLFGTDAKSQKVNSTHSAWPVRPRKFSDGSFWDDPEPPFGISDPDDPGWMPRYFHHARRQSWQMFGAGNGWWRKNWLSDHVVESYRNNNQGTWIPKGGHSVYPQIDLFGVNVYLATLYPDGRYRVYINGLLEIDNGPTKLLIADRTGTSSSQRATTSSWANDQARYDASVEDYGTFSFTYTPVPHITLPQPSFVNGSQSSAPFTEYSIFKPISTSATEWCEYLAFPKAFTPTDIARLHNYFKSKYDNLTDLHKDYSLA